MMLESVHTPLRQSNSEDTRFTSPLLTPNEPRWGCRPRTEASQKASGAHGDVHTSKGLNLAIDISTIRSTPTIPGPPVGPIAVCPQTKSARTIDGTNTWARCNRKYGALPADDRTRCIAHS
jgi:hypothetical protein